MKTKKQIKEMCKVIACNLIKAENNKRLNAQYLNYCWQYIARLAILDYDKELANIIGLEDMLETIKNN